MALAGVALHTVNQIVAAVPAVPAPVKNRAAPTCLKGRDEGVQRGFCCVGCARASAVNTAGYAGSRYRCIRNRE